VSVIPTDATVVELATGSDMEVLLELRGEKDIDWTPTIAFLVVVPPDCVRARVQIPMYVAELAVLGHVQVTGSPVESLPGVGI
jgi:hypothetical protein